MPAVRCSACGLINPSSAVMCDCGQVLNVVDSETMAKARETNREMIIERQREELAKGRDAQAVRTAGVVARFLRIFTG